MVCNTHKWEWCLKWGTSNQWTLLLTSHPVVIFYLMFWSFTLDLWILENNKRHGGCLWILLFSISDVSSSPQCHSSNCSHFGCTKCQLLSLQLVRWLPFTLVLSAAAQCRKFIQRISEVNVELTCVLLFSPKLPSLKSSYVGCLPLSSNSCFVYFV